MSELFETCRIGNIELKNRFVRSATWEGMAPDTGEINDGLLDLYRALAEGGVGLIIGSYAFVDKRGRCNPGMIGIDDDGLMPGLRRLAQTIHDGGGKVITQIAHGGAQTTVDTGFPAEAPSAVADRSSGKMPVEMSQDDIERVVAGFVAAARRTKACGFDGVQLHSAHGYLLLQFLSPHTNVRTDEYGGSIENRARMLFEVYDRVREEVGADYPVLVKINVSDFDETGLTAEDSLWVCEQLSERGIDGIELSGGGPYSGRSGPARTKIYDAEKEAYFREQAKVFTPRLKCPVILVGGIRSLEVAEELLGDGVAQFFSMSRPLISEPGLVNRWASGDRKRARCASCNKCFGTTSSEKGLHCATFDGEEGLSV